MSESDTRARRQSAPPPPPRPALVPPVSRSASGPSLAYAPNTLDWVERLTGVRPKQPTTVASATGTPAPSPGPAPVAPPPTQATAPRAPPLVQPPARVVPPPPPRSAQLQQVINEQLMTFSDLAAKIGHAPHADRLGGAWKMSKRYKAVEGAFGSADAELAAAQAKPLAGLDKTGWATLEQDVGGKLDNLVLAATNYRAKYANKQTKRDAADDLIIDATRYKQTLSDQLKAVRTDPGLAGVQQHLTVDQALTAKRLGINFADCRLDLYNDSALDAAKSQAGFGAGKMNSVSKLVHADGTARIFKPEAFADPGGAKATGTMGVDPDAPHFGNRNIATRTVADLLDASVIPQARFALHNGQFGLLMDKAPGQSPGQNVKIANFDATKDTWFKSTLAQVTAGKADPDALTRAGYKKGDDGVWQRTRKELVKPWTAPPSPAAQASLHGQLNQLEWCDVLSGQMDRQPENYMVEIKGDQAAVTGIDNDLCFGKNQAKAEYSMAEGSTSVGKPHLIDAATLAKMKAIDFNRDVAPRLAGLLSTEEIDASRQRFAAVHQHAMQLEAQGLVVDPNWKDWRAPDGSTASEFLAAKKGGSIFSRDLAKFFKADGVL